MARIKLFEKGFTPIRYIHHLLWAAVSCIPAADAVGEKLLYHERLMPAATAYVDLLLCANTADMYRNDGVSAERYRKAAFEVQDLTDEAGWSPDAVAATVTKLHESRSDLDLRDDDSPESFYLRNFSFERCERDLQNVRAFRENGVPAP